MALLAIVVHLILDWILVGPLGIAGIALATTLTVFNLSMLTFFLRRKIGNLGFTQLVAPVAVMMAGFPAFLLRAINCLLAH